MKLLNSSIGLLIDVIISDGGFSFWKADIQNVLKKATFCDKAEINRVPRASEKM